MNWKESSSLETVPVLGWLRWVIKVDSRARLYDGHFPVGYHLQPGLHL